MSSRASLSRSVCGIGVVFVLAVSAACSRESREDAAKAVEKLPAQAERQLERAASVLDDATITAKVKSALIAEPQLKGLAIDVDTSKNVVTLSGSVASEQARADAERIAKQVEGVAGVKNNLEVKKPS
jgi:hyperosmotically inducible protein